jgi:sporulation integral membrane protein YtvI
MEPAIKFIMKKMKFSRRISSIIIFAIVFSIIVGILVLGITTLISETTNLMEGLNNYFDKAYIQLQNIINNFGFNKVNLSNEVRDIIQNSTSEFLDTLSNWVKNVLNGLINFITSVPTIAIYFIITILSLYFICTDKIYMLDQIEHHLPEKWVKKIGIHLREIIKVLGSFLKAECILILISFIISLIGLYVFKIMHLNVEYPLLIALAIGFVDALPILGSGTVMVPWGIISALNGDLKLGIAIIVLWIIMSVVRQIIEPKIVSKQIGIHPIFTLIAMYTGFKFLGVIGMIIGPIILIIFKNVFATFIDNGVIKSIFDKK